ncbi:MAG: hypothetical protein ACRDZ2_06025, partial [Ilumatobacteraceae bacterium]
MSSIDHQVLTWLRSHHATISADALSAAGISLEQRKYLVAKGLLQRVVDGAYLFAGSEPGELARCAALCTSRPHLVVAGPTAARMWGLRRAPRDGLVHVIAPPRSHPCQEPWVRAYRTSALCGEHVVHRHDGIRVTNPSRTAVDLTRYVSEDSVASIIEDVLHRGLSTISSLRCVADALATPGRPWARRFLRLLDRRHPGAPAASDGERRVFEALAHRGVTGLERQVEVVLPGYGYARFDIAIPALRWAVEIDLHPEHKTPGGIARDNLRDDCADIVGWKTRRVGEVELEQHFDSTIDRLVAVIERRRTALG